MTRKLNVNEHLSWQISKVTPHNCVIAIEFSGKIHIESIEYNLQSLFEYHSLLNYSYSLTSNYFYRLSNPRINFEYLASNQQIDRVVENELNS
jgi:hypothetical protein